MAVKKCEKAWPGDDTLPREILTNLPADLEGDIKPLFDTRTNKCNTVAWRGYGSRRCVVQSSDTNPDYVMPRKFQGKDFDTRAYAASA